MSITQLHFTMIVLPMSEHPKRPHSSPLFRVHLQVNWGDSKGGHGEHYFEYNHAPKGYEADHHQKGYSEPEPVYARELPVYPPLQDA